MLKLEQKEANCLAKANLRHLQKAKASLNLQFNCEIQVIKSKLPKYPLPLTNRKLERAFNENLIETYIKIIKNSPKKARSYLSLYLLRFEIEHIKMLLRANSAKLTPDQKSAKIYFSVEDYLKKHAVIEEAVKASTVNQIIHAFKGTEYWSALNTGLKNYEENGSTTCFDVFIDKLFYENLYDSYNCLPKKEKQYASFYVSIENDGFVLLTLLRGKLLGHEPNWLRLVIPQNYFNLSKATVEALVSAVDFEAAFKIVLDSYYGKYFVKAQNPEETIANAGKAFKKAMFQHAKSSAISETFNIGSPLAFMTQKEAEVFNLTILSLSVSSEMKHDELRNHLLL